MSTLTQISNVISYLTKMYHFKSAKMLLSDTSACDIEDCVAVLNAQTKLNTRRLRIEIKHQDKRNLV